MKSIKNEFPNPVLADGRDDYIAECRFHTAFDDSAIVVDAGNISFPISYTLVCNGLQALISEGKAVVIVLVKSSAASYSKIFRFPVDKTEMDISIPKYSVIKKIDVVGAVIAAQNMNDFHCPGEFNELYFGTSTFEIRKGDMLATEDERSIFVDDSELEKPISSIFTISRRDEQENDIEPNYYGDKIEVFLKSELFDLYYKLKDFNNGALRRYTSGIIVYPVLVEAIYYILSYYQNGEDEEGGNWSEKRWFRAIDQKADGLGIDLRTYQDSPTTLANKLLGNICLDAMKSFKDTLDDEINSGETQMIGGID